MAPKTDCDAQAAFRGAVRKRVSAANSNHPVFVGLSSGYDSGALHLALEAEAPRHSVQYFTVAAEESVSLGVGGETETSGRRICGTARCVISRHGTEMWRVAQTPRRRE